jgi:hypothetical protein
VVLIVRPVTSVTVALPSAARLTSRFPSAEAATASTGSRMLSRGGPLAP